MSTNPDTSTHQSNNTPRDTTIRKVTTSTEGLTAAEFLQRRIQARESDVASRAALKFDERSPIPPEGALQAASTCGACLIAIATPNALSSLQAIRFFTVDVSLKGQNATVAQPKEVMKDLSLKATQALVGRNITILLAALTCLEKDLPYEAAIGKAQDILTQALKLIEGPADTAIPAIQQHLDSKRTGLNNAAHALGKLVEYCSPEAREARRDAALKRATDEDLSDYRHSTEYRALKLLALVQDSSREESTVKRQKLELAKKLLPVGIDTVVSNLRALTPDLALTEKDIDTVKALVDEASKLPVKERPTPTPQRSRYTTRVESSPSKEEAVTSSNSPTEAQPVQPEDQDTQEYKLLLLEELGIKDQKKREGLCEDLSYEGVMNAVRAFEGIPTEATQRILEVNPDLISPTGEINLPSFVADLKQFLDKSYDLLNLPTFDPARSPNNFASPSALKRTKRAAEVVRTASRNRRP
jgi:hypothetical protein